ncbi:MAG: hypothetical protein LLF94_11975 [Chlamydiales bacterium]|nr:hypothetical protein [Chlamydiales bacterium]
MSYSTSPDFLHRHSDEHLRYYGQESDMEALTDSMNTVSLSTTACNALERYAKGKNVDLHIAQLAVLLQNPLDKKFSQLSARDMQANILLVLCRYSHEQRLDDLALLSLMLPYYISVLLKNGDELCGSIITKELMECLDNPNSPLMHDLDFRISNFLKGNLFYRYSKHTELEYLTKLLKKIVPDHQPGIKEAFTASLQCWARAVGPEPAHLAAISRKVAELTCLLSTTERSPTLTFFHFKRLLDTQNQYTDEFLKELYLWQLTEFDQGNDISSYIGSIENVLMGQEAIRYTDFTTDHKLVNVWLLIKAWEETHDERYRDVLLLALPHVAVNLYELLPMPTCAQVIAGNFHKDKANVGKFGEVLIASHVCFDVEEAAVALNNYTRTVKATVDDVKAAVELFGSVLAHPYGENKEYLAKMRLLLLDRYAEKADMDADTACYVLHALSCDAETTNITDWAKNLQDGSIKDLFVKLVNSPQFTSSQTRKVLMKHLLFASEPPTSLELAIRLLPSITAVNLATLLNRVQGHGKFDLFAREVALVSPELKDTIMQALQYRSPFVTLFERAIRWEPEHPGMDFLLSFVNSNYATEVQRRGLYQACIHPKAPPHYLGFAPRMLRISDVKELQTFTDMLIERVRENRDCSAMAPFLECINGDKVNGLVRNNLCRYLLNKNTPESIYLLSRMSQHLTLSAVWTLIKRIDALQPKKGQDFEFRRLAVSHLLSAKWYHDYFPGRNSEQRKVLLQKILNAQKAGTVFRPIKNWYEERNIILYTKTDSYAVRIPERIRCLMRRCGLTGKKYETIASTKIAKLVESQLANKLEGRKKAPSTYRSFVLSIAAASHYRRVDAEALRQAAIALEATMHSQELPEAQSVEEVEELIERSTTPGLEDQD